jgi:hypothetical protein
MQYHVDLHAIVDSNNDKDTDNFLSRYGGES